VARYYENSLKTIWRGNDLVNFNTLGNLWVLCLWVLRLLFSNRELSSKQVRGFIGRDAWSIRADGHFKKWYDKTRQKVQVIEELKPCPFCGSECDSDFAEFEEGDYIFTIWCDNEDCGVEMKGVSTKTKAISAWNRREK